MKILVTGSSGRVGRAIHICLTPRHAVQGYDRVPSSTTQWVGELDDGALLKRALVAVDAVVHVAALHAPHVPYCSEAEFTRVNVDGTQRLLDAAVLAGVRRLVFTSTTALYGAAATPAGRASWVDEALLPEPVTIYHRSKLAAEALLRVAAEQGGPSVRILRMSRCFPEPANVMALFRLHRGVDARDVASAHELALTHAGHAHQTFVISGETPFLRADVDRLYHDAAVVLALRCPALVSDFRRLGWALPSQIDRVYCSAAASAALGWRPRYGYDDVLELRKCESSEVLPAQVELDWKAD